MAQRCSVSQVLCFSLLVVTPVLAAETLESVAASPRISGTLTARVDSRLREGFPEAMQRVRDVFECRDLFTRLGVDAPEKVTTSIQYPTTAQTEDRVCRRGAVAFTDVGTPQTRLCRGFSSLGTERAAVTLIHEALHLAGMSETPLDEHGLEPRDIDRIVKKACHL